MTSLQSLLVSANPEFPLDYLQQVVAKLPLKSLSLFVKSTSGARFSQFPSTLTNLSCWGFVDLNHVPSSVTNFSAKFDFETIYSIDRLTSLTYLQCTYAAGPCNVLWTGLSNLQELHLLGNFTLDLGDKITNLTKLEVSCPDLAQ
jgi:hypothetical protein